MEVTVVVDNIGTKECKGEWGLCLYIEYDDKKILLDTGESELFAENLKKMGIDIKDIDFAVLSHAHSDHAGGMPCFFKNNDKAMFYIQESCKENCFMKIGPFKAYQGIPRGTLTDYDSRIKRVSGKTEIYNGIYILSHNKADIPAGKAQRLFINENKKYISDDFSHEQSLIFRTDKGLIVFNSCSHTGADSIINEVKKSFPGEKIYAYMGGLHFLMMPKKYIRKIARGISESGIEKIYTGHCTEEKGFRIIKKELGDMAEQFRVGMEIEF